MHERVAAERYTVEVLNTERRLESGRKDNRRSKKRSECDHKYDM